MIDPIATSMEPLDQSQILQLLEPDSKRLLDELIILDAVDSTNDYLLRTTKTQSVIACLAEQQTAGKGRQGRHWISPPRSQIACSLSWRFDKKPSEIVGFSLAVAVAAARALTSFGVTQGLGLKWPNDIYHNGAKLVGILVETAAESPHNCRAVIGVGINIHLPPPLANGIQQPWTDLKNILPGKISRNRLAGLLLNELLTALPQFSKSGLPPFLKEWRALDYLCGKKIILTTAQQTFTGIMQGVSSSGELLLEENGQIYRFINGSVRVFNS